MEPTTMRALELQLSRLLEASALDEDWHRTHHNNMTLMAQAINDIAKAINAPIVSVTLKQMEPKAARKVGNNNNNSNNNNQVSTLHMFIMRCVGSGTLFTDEDLHRALRDVKDTQRFMELQDVSFEATLPLLKLWVTNPTFPRDQGVAFLLLYEGARLFPHVLQRKAHRATLREAHAALMNLGENESNLRALQLGPETVVGFCHHLGNLCGL
eukprot:PhF_6_TR10997/c0_g1_i2/m.17801